MGCITSKVISRSLSYRDDLLKHRYFPTPHPEQDTTLPPPNTQEPETINTWELMAGLEDDPLTTQQQDTTIPVPIGTPPHQAKMVQCRPASISKEENVRCSPLHNESFLLGPDEHFDLGTGGRTLRSRSFHTVEEYDALFVEKMCQPSTMAHTTMLDTESNLVETTAITPDSDKVSCTAGQSNATREDTSTNVFEKGFKRNRVAKGLAGSLNIPPTVQFSGSTVSLGQWLQAGGQAFSPGGPDNYVTPKFGSYSHNKVHTNKRTSAEESIIDPQLLASFEVCMQQLQDEEDKLIQQINNELLTHLLEEEDD